jgi:hypothetical protein
LTKAEEIKVAPPKNWDKLVAEEIEKQGEDKPEGEAAMNELLKKIYGEGAALSLSLSLPPLSISLSHPHPPSIPAPPIQAFRLPSKSLPFPRFVP